MYAFSLKSQDGSEWSLHDKAKIDNGDLKVGATEAWQEVVQLCLVITGTSQEACINVTISVQSQGSVDLVSSITSGLLPIGFETGTTPLADFIVDMNASTATTFTYSLPAVNYNFSTSTGYDVEVSSSLPSYLTWVNSTKSFQIDRTSLLTSSDTFAVIDLEFKLTQNGAKSDSYSLKI